MFLNCGRKVHHLNIQKRRQYQSSQLSSNHTTTCVRKSVLVLNPQPYVYIYIYFFIAEQIYIYIESNIQKGFCEGISGTVEHTELLTHVINHARVNQRQLVVTLLDLKNAFGEVEHKFIMKILDYHHIPPSIKRIIYEYYDDYAISMGTKDFITNPIIVHKWVLQGDWLSPLLFKMCFNSLLKCIDEERIKSIGYICLQ